MPASRGQFTTCLYYTKRTADRSGFVVLDYGFWALRSSAGYYSTYEKWRKVIRPNEKSIDTRLSRQ